MKGIVGAMKQVAEKEIQRVYTTELGVVTAIFPHAEEGDGDNYQCSVKLKNKKLPDGSDFELPKVPVSTPYVGMACIPNLGDLVLVNFIGGSLNAPVITGRLYNDEDIPPPNQEKEFLLQHSLQEGGSIKLDQEGKIILTSKSEKDVVTVEDDKVSIVNEKNVVTVEDDKVSIVNDKFSLTIDIEGKISILSDSDIELSTETGTFSVTAQEITLEATGAMVLKGSTIDLN